MTYDWYHIDELEVLLPALDHAPVRSWIALVARAHLRTWAGLSSIDLLSPGDLELFRCPLEATRLLASSAHSVELSDEADEAIIAVCNRVDEKYGQQSFEGAITTNYWALQRVVREFGDVVDGQASRESVVGKRLADTVMGRINNAIFVGRYFGLDEQIGMQCLRDVHKLESLPREKSPAELFVDSSEAGPFGKLWASEPPTWERTALRLLE